jgi:Phage capsid family
MPDTEGERSLLDKLREQRTKNETELASLAGARETQRSAFDAERSAFEAIASPTDEQRAAYDAKVAAFSAAEDQHGSELARRQQDIGLLRRRITEQRTVERSRKAAARSAARVAGASDVSVRSEPLTYSQDNRFEQSYFADLACAQSSSAAGAMRHRSPAEALERLQHHAAEMDVEMPRRAALREKEARKAIERSEASRRGVEGGEFLSDPFHRGHVMSPFEQRTPPSRVQGAGGYFVPPLWWSDFIAGLRPGRVTAGLCNSMPLPSGTDSINIPKLANLTTVAVQSADNQPVSQSDWTDTAVTANVKTLAGQSDIAIQILDQSPYPVDQMILQDLMADYNKQLDLQVLNGNGTNPTPLNAGQVVGLYSSAAPATGPRRTR